MIRGRNSCPTAKLVQMCFIYLLWRVGHGENEQHEGLKQGTSAGLGVGVQVRRIMGEKVQLLIAALELWPAFWNTKDRSDTLQWLGPVNIWPTSGMPRFLFAYPLSQTRKSWSSRYVLPSALCFYSPGLTGRPAHAPLHSLEWCNHKDRVTLLFHYLSGGDLVAVLWSIIKWVLAYGPWAHNQFIPKHMKEFHQTHSICTSRTKCLRSGGIAATCVLIWEWLEDKLLFNSVLIGKAVIALCFLPPPPIVCWRLLTDVVGGFGSGFGRQTLFFSGVWKKQTKRAVFVWSPPPPSPQLPPCFYSLGSWFSPPTLARHPSVYFLAVFFCILTCLQGGGQLNSTDG